MTHIRIFFLWMVFILVIPGSLMRVQNLDSLLNNNSVYNPILDFTGDLFGMKGNHVVMFKLNFWSSV